MKYVFLFLILSFDFTNAQTDTTIPNDVFPLIAGHRFEYTGYFTIQDTEIPVTGTSAFYNTSWTVVSSNITLSAIFGPLAAVIASTPNGKTSAAFVSDTTLVTPPSTKKIIPVMAYYDSTTADYYYLTNFGLFFRSSRVKDSSNAADVRKDSLRFIKLASPKAGIGGIFTSFEENFVSYANPSAPTTINLAIRGKWESKTDVTVNGKTFSSYYLIILRTVKVGTAVVSTGVTAKIWLAKGIGPVKMFLAGDAENNGHFRELKETNFPTTVVERKSSDKFPAAFRLEQNYPNPFNPETRIEYHLTNNEFVTLKVFDVLGKEIATLVDGDQTKGSYVATFSTSDGNASNLSSGLYFYQLKAGRNVETRKMVLMR